MSTSISFAGGVTNVINYGERWAVTFLPIGYANANTWVAGDTWALSVTSTAGDFTLGANYLRRQTGIYPSGAFVYRQRIYVPIGPRFNFCGNDKPDGWEEQDYGASYVEYQSQFGAQDSVVAFSQLQGRLVVLARRSIQIWTVDADPNAFVLGPTLDNIGTLAMHSVQNLGDYDVLFLDDTGFRSLRTRDTTGDAYADDIGTPIDTLVRTSMALSDWSDACSVVDPTTKCYWCFVNDKIYVLSRYLGNKITAWSTFTPTYDTSQTIAPTENPAVYDADGHVHFTGLVVGERYAWTMGNSTEFHAGSLPKYTSSIGFVATGTTAFAVGTVGQTCTGVLNYYPTATGFTPVKFVTYNGVIYARAANNELVSYTGYDKTVVTIQTPWLDDRSPDVMKNADSIEAVAEGAWKVYAGMDPKSETYDLVFDNGSITAPESLDDSSYDIGRIPYSAHGSHFSLKAISSKLTNQCVKFSAVSFRYNIGET